MLEMLDCCSPESSKSRDDSTSLRPAGLIGERPGMRGIEGGIGWETTLGCSFCAPPVLGDIRILGEFTLAFPGADSCNTAAGGFRGKFIDCVPITESPLAAFLESSFADLMVSTGLDKMFLGSCCTWRRLSILFADCLGIALLYDSASTIEPEGPSRLDKLPSPSVPDMDARLGIEGSELLLCSRDGLFLPRSFKSRKRRVTRASIRCIIARYPSI